MIKCLDQVYREHNLTVLTWLWVAKVSKCVSRDIAVYIARILYDDRIDVKRNAFLILGVPCVFVGRKWYSLLLRGVYYGACSNCLRPNVPCCSKSNTIAKDRAKDYHDRWAVHFEPGDNFVISTYPYVEIISSIVDWDEKIRIVTEFGNVLYLKKNAILSTFY